MNLSLALHHVSYGFADQPPLLEDAAFDFGSGVYRISGPTGSGVSSTLRLLNGLLSPTSGSVLWNGTDLAAWVAQDPKNRLQLGFVHRSGGLMANQTILANILFPGLYHGLYDEVEGERLVLPYLEAFGLSTQANVLPAWTSSTVRKCASILRALLLKPAALILDEPMDGLNAEASGTIVGILKEAMQRDQLGLIVLGTQDAGWDKALGIQVLELASRKLGKRP